MENNYQLSRIHNYVNGLMSGDDMHALEQEALQDPFLQDAIDGYRLQKGVDARSLSLLQQRLEKRVAAHAFLKDRHYFNWQRLAIGLVAAVLFIAVSTLLLMRYFPNRDRSNITEVELMDNELQKVVSKPVAGFNAQPIGGWASFDSYLSTNYSGNNPTKELMVSFKVNASGIAYEIQTDVDSDHQISKELKELFAKGPKWTGSAGRIKIIFPE